MGVENPTRDLRILAPHGRLVAAAADADLLESQRMIMIPPGRGRVGRAYLEKGSVPGAPTRGNSVRNGRQPGAIRLVVETDGHQGHRLGDAQALC